jgi:hypothetical protein
MLHSTKTMQPPHNNIILVQSPLCLRTFLTFCLESKKIFGKLVTRKMLQVFQKVDLKGSVQMKEERGLEWY